MRQAGFEPRAFGSVPFQALSRTTRYIPPPMMRRLRGVAFAAALSVVSSGTGLPMCLSLLSQAAAPCPMHGQRQRDGAHHGVAQSIEAMSKGSVDMCHPDETGPGCAIGGVCPTGGPAAMAAVQSADLRHDAARAAVFGPPDSYVSYLAPPLPPPPQA